METSEQHAMNLISLARRQLEYVRALRKLQWACLVLLAVLVLIPGLAKYDIINLASEGGALLMGVIFITIAVVGLIIGMSVWWLHREIRKIDAEFTRAEGAQ